MTSANENDAVEWLIDRWRQDLRSRQTVHADGVASLEARLREQIAGLHRAGLTTDEALLVAMKRMSELDGASREFARIHAQRLWKRLVAVRAEHEAPRASERVDAIVAFGVALAAAVAVKLPALFDMDLETHAGFYARNGSLFALPLLAAYFVWKRGFTLTTVCWLVPAFAAAAVFANAYPFVAGGNTEVLSALHLPIALWLVVGIAYAGNRWTSVAGRMDFIRFSGELLIQYVLIALGGAVLIAFMALIFESIGIDIDFFLSAWLVPCGVMGAVVVSAWLVETRQDALENIAPILTRLFTPLFAAVLLAFLATALWTGRGVAIERNMLIAFDLLLVVVLGLLLYWISARDPRAPPGTFDLLQLVLLASALLVNAVALWAIGARISEFGFTPNRVAAVGENAILLVNLAGSAVLYAQFLRGRGSFARLERWQTDYLPVYAGWAALVVIVFPPLFGYI